MVHKKRSQGIREAAKFRIVVAYVAGPACDIEEGRLWYIVGFSCYVFLKVASRSGVDGPVYFP